jgi:hypothetical protein
MPARLVIAARPFIRNGVMTYKKGDIVALVTEGGDFGTKEVPPDFVRLEISDATTPQVQQFVEQWVVDFKHTIVSENALGWRFRVEVDDAYVDASERSKVMIRRRMIEHIDDATSGPWEGCITQSFTPTELIVDIPKNGVYQTANSLSDNAYLLTLKADFSDIFRESVAVRRYYFNEADVDTAYNLPNGQVTLTTAQALTKIVDKLTE